MSLISTSADAPIFDLVAVVIDVVVVVVAAAADVVVEVTVAFGFDDSDAATVIAFFVGCVI